MHFLADESCDFAVVRALRQAGHEVTAIAEISGSGSRFAHRFVVVQPGRLRIID